MKKIVYFQKKCEKGIDFFEKKSIILYVAASGNVYARVAELADAHVWGACGYTVRVQVPFLAPKNPSQSAWIFYLFSKAQTELHPLFVRKNVVEI